MKIKVLIVDDHQIVREGIKKILSEIENIDVCASVSNGQEALQHLKQSQTDIVIADLSMPDMSGIELTEQITANFPSIKVLILSMFNDEDYIYNAIKAGAKGYLQKQDSSATILSDAIQCINSGEEYYSLSISKIMQKSFAKNAKSAAGNESQSQMHLTVRENEILKLFANGFTNMEIANKLCISIHTVKTHKNNIMIKYNFKSTVEMIKFALKNNMIDL